MDKTFRFNLPSWGSQAECDRYQKEFVDFLVKMGFRRYEFSVKYEHPSSALLVAVVSVKNYAG